LAQSRNGATNYTNGHFSASPTRYEMFLDISIWWKSNVLPATTALSGWQDSSGYPSYCSQSCKFSAKTKDGS
jgi:hypothetical protein